MTYADYYYTYQIGIVFAILVAALLLLACTVAAIYFACVGPMRERSSSASPTMIKRAPPLQSWTEQPPPPVVVTLPPQTTYTTSTPSPQQPTQAGGSEYMAPIGQRVSPAYSQQIPLVQPIDYLPASGQQQYRMLQPVALQQQQTSTVQTPGSVYYDPNQGAWQSVLDAPPRTSYQASAV